MYVEKKSNLRAKTRVASGSDGPELRHLSHQRCVEGFPRTRSSVDERTFPNRSRVFLVSPNRVSMRFQCIVHIRLHFISYLAKSKLKHRIVVQTVFFSGFWMRGSCLSQLNHYLVLQFNSLFHESHIKFQVWLHASPRFQSPCSLSLS